MRILPQDTMAIVIDIQEKMIPVIKDKESIINNTITLLKGLQVLEIPIMVSRQYPKGLGDTIEEIKEVTKEAPILDKIEFSCFDNTEMKAFIEKSGKKNIIICGVEAHVCVLQTVVDLSAHGFKPILIDDCIGSRTENNKKVGVKRALAEGAFLSSYESILFELLRVSGSDVFKKISVLVK